MRALLTFMFALLLVALGGCIPLLRAAPAELNVSPLRPYTFDFAPDVTPAERAAFEAEYPAWNAVTKTSHRMRSAQPGETANWHVFFKDYLFDSKINSELHGRECTSAGRDCPVAHSIMIKRGLEPARLSVVARHEQGHALQLRHIAEDGVMRPGAPTPATSLTLADLAECRVAGACP
jgi:hypothetical protein